MKVGYKYLMNNILILSKEKKKWLKNLIAKNLNSCYLIVQRMSR